MKHSENLNHDPIPPFLNGLINFSRRHSFPGKYRFYLWCKEKFKHRPLISQINQRQFASPVEEWCFWQEGGPERYYVNEFIPFAQWINSHLDAFTLFDLGADIGTVSSFVEANCPKFANTICIEPNPFAFNMLAFNVSLMTKTSHVFHGAISDKQAKAKLVVREGHESDHEGHIELDENGDIEVTSLDGFVQTESNLHIESDIVLKIDVEGQELQAINGAKETVSHSRRVVILLELHPEVLEAAHMTPEILFEACESIRDFTWVLPLDGCAPIDRSTDFFNQYERKQYDVIGYAC